MLCSCGMDAGESIYAGNINFSNCLTDGRGSCILYNGPSI